MKILYISYHIIAVYNWLVFAYRKFTDEWCYFALKGGSTNFAWSFERERYSNKRIE
jgi:hypothetical protein